MPHPRQILNHTRPLSEAPCAFSYRAMYKANKLVTLHFAEYLPIYGVTSEILFRDCGAMLTFFETMVYSTDLELEAAQASDQPQDSIRRWVERKNFMVRLLQEENLYEPVIEQYLDGITRYWELETQMVVEEAITWEALQELSRVVFLDVLVAHLICHKILKIPLDKGRVETLWAMFWVEELEANFIEYPRDVAEGNFNIYKMFIKLFGAEARLQANRERERRLCYVEECIAALPRAMQEPFQKAFAARAHNYHLYYFLDRPTLPEAPEPLPS